MGWLGQRVSAYIIFLAVAKFPSVGSFAFPRAICDSACPTVKPPEHVVSLLDHLQFEVGEVTFAFMCIIVSEAS
jgi:hypothetical protein